MGERKQTGLGKVLSNDDKFLKEARNYAFWWTHYQSELLRWTKAKKDRDEILDSVRQAEFECNKAHRAMIAAYKET